MKLTTDMTQGAFAVGIVASLALSVALIGLVSRNQAHLADIEGKLAAGVDDRYRAQDARRDLDQIRELIGVAVETHDRRLTAIEERLKAVEDKTGVK